MKIDEKIKSEIIEHIDNNDLISAKKLFFKKLKAAVHYYYKRNYNPESGTLFTHYTTVDTVFNMLQSEKPLGLRLYDTRSFNDPDEGHFLKDEISKRYEFMSVSEIMPEAYVCSFVSPNPDDEGMNDGSMNDKLIYWRSYGNDGSGCSITLPEDFKGKFKKISYGDKNAEKVIEKFEDYFEMGELMYEKINDPIEGAFRNSVFVDTFMNCLRKIIFLHKDESYRYENECRLIETPVGRHKPVFDVQNSSTGGTHIRKFIHNDYLALKNIFASGSEVVIGPRVYNKEVVEQYMSDLMKQKKLQGPTIKVSKINYQSP